MSTVHAPVASDRDARPAGRHGTGARARVMALSADHVAVLALATVAVLLAAITWNRWGDPSYDTGLDLVAGRQGLARPSALPGLRLLVRPARRRCCSASSSRSPGIAMGPAVGLGLLLAAACIGLTYAVGRLLLAPLPAALAAALAAVPALSSTNISYVQPHALDAPLGVLPRARRGPRRRALRDDRRPPLGRRHGRVPGPVPAHEARERDRARPRARRLARRAGGRRRRGRSRGARSATSPWPWGLPCSSASAGTRPSSSPARWSTTRSRWARSSTATSSRPGCCGSRSPSSTTCWPRARRRASLALAADLALYLTGTAGLIAIGLTLAGRAPWRRAVLAVAGLAVVGVLVVLVARPGHRALLPQVGLRLDAGGRAARRGAPGLAADPPAGALVVAGRAGPAPARAAGGRLLLQRVRALRALSEPGLPAGHGLRDAGARDPARVAARPRRPARCCRSAPRRCASPARCGSPSWSCAAWGSSCTTRARRRASSAARTGRSARRRPTPRPTSRRSTSCCGGPAAPSRSSSRRR